MDLFRGVLEEGIGLSHFELLMYRSQPERRGSE